MLALALTKLMFEYANSVYVEAAFKARRNFLAVEVAVFDVYTSVKFN